MGGAGADPLIALLPFPPTLQADFLAYLPCVIWNVQSFSVSLSFKAIDQSKKKLASGPDETPAIFLKTQGNYQT